MKRLLVVDDQPNIRMMIRLTIQRDFAVEEADSADAALEMILQDPPAGIVLDVMMPGTINGFQLCERIKRDGTLAGIHVVLVTACGQVTDQELGRALGADAYFIKPFSPMALAQHLRAALLPANSQGAPT
jgi:DNA-binding response OmpR family regulator